MNLNDKKINYSKKTEETMMTNHNIWVLTLTFVMQLGFDFQSQKRKYYFSVHVLFFVLVFLTISEVITGAIVNTFTHIFDYLVINKHTTKIKTKCS